MPKATPSKSTESSSRGGTIGNRSGGDTSRQVAKGGGQRGGGTSATKSKGSSTRAAKSDGTVASSGSQSSPRKSARPPGGEAQRKPVGRRGRSNGGGTDADGESNIRGEP